MKKELKYKKIPSIVKSFLPSFQVLFVSCYVWENMHYPCVCAIVSHLWRPHYVEMSEGFLFYCYWSMKSVITAHIFFHLGELCHLTLVFQNTLHCGKTNKENPCFWFSITLAAVRNGTFAQAGNTKFKHASAGYVKQVAWFVNETENSCWLYQLCCTLLSTLKIKVRLLCGKNTLGCRLTNISVFSNKIKLYGKKPSMSTVNIARHHPVYC